MICTKSGFKIAEDYNRIVGNDRGENYYEIHPSQIVYKNIYVPRDKLWKITKKGIQKIDYIEFRTREDNVKVYYQIDIKMSKYYANYTKFFFYINVKDSIELSL